LNRPAVDVVTVACIRVMLCVVSTTKSSKWDTTRSLRYNQDSQREEGLSLILQPVVVNKTCASYLPKVHFKNFWKKKIKDNWLTRFT